MANLSGFNVFNVLDAGIVGIGGLDQTLAIQNVINTAQGAGGGVIYFPAGEYTVSPEDRSYCLQVTGDNIWLVGDGATSLIANASMTGDTILFGSGALMNPSLVTNCGVRDLVFFPSVTRSPDSYEINVPYFQNLHVARCVFFPNVSTRSAGLHGCIRLGNNVDGKMSNKASVSEIDAATYFTLLFMVQVSDAWVYACNADSDLELAVTLVIEWGCVGIKLSECGFINTFLRTFTNNGICMQIRASGSKTPPAQCQFSQVYFDSHAIGVEAAAGQDMTFTNCWFSDRPGNGVLFSATDGPCDSWTFYQCIFANCGADGVLVTPGPPGNPVSNIGLIGCDVFSNNRSGGSGTANGITVAGGYKGGIRIVGCRCYNSTRYNNLFGGTQVYGIYIPNKCDNFIVAGNDAIDRDRTGVLRGGLFNASIDATSIVDNNLGKYTHN